MKVKTKNRSHRHDIYRPTSRHGLSDTKYKKCLSTMIKLSSKNNSRYSKKMI